jgi:putative DNA modification/repair radical SAM protein
MELQQKLEILADAAKYDASCASSGAARKDSRSGKGVGSTGGAGICHSYTPDGRCISLLKVLMTNVCLYDCHYCINRRSSNVERARFTPEEVVQITLDFYKRNYIEGLFLSSGIIRSADYTMELVTEVARQLRELHHFRGYIHLKTIPEASPELIERAGRFADRISINIELPVQASLVALAPEKNLPRTLAAMAHIRNKIDAAQERVMPSPIRAGASKAVSKGASVKATAVKTGPIKSAPAKLAAFARSQSTQMIIGADASTDAVILQRADSLYHDYKLRRVYYSGFSPTPQPSVMLPLQAPPLLREHRLYQADWLLRFYEFKVDEIASAQAPNLDLAVDPKLGWALQNRADFPIDINRAPRERLLRIPGVGVRSVDRIISARRFARLRLADLLRLRLQMKKLLPFIITADHHPQNSLDSEQLRARFMAPPMQLDLDFASARSAAPTALDVHATLSGEL